MLDRCIAGVGPAPLAAEYRRNRQTLLDLDVPYRRLGLAAELYTIPPVHTPRRPEPEPEIAGRLTRSKLVSLYSDYLVGSAKPGRELYDTLLASVSHCPYCGGLGQASTLDHYLPKAKFPLHSVLPANLIPSCKDCNFEKSDAIATQKGEQVLHPYLDEQKFFDEQWLQAVAQNTNPITFVFEVVSPAIWSDDDKARVLKHSTEHGLVFRFSQEANAHMSTVRHERKTVLEELTPQQYRQVLITKSNTNDLPINHWRRLSYQALSNAAWFYSRHPATL